MLCLDEMLCLDLVRFPELTTVENRPADTKLGIGIDSCPLQISPQPSAFFSGLTFFALAPTNSQTSSHCSRHTRTLPAVLWQAEHTQSSASHFTILFFGTQVM